MRKLFRKRHSVFIKLIQDQANLTLQGMEASKSLHGRTGSGCGCQPDQE